MTAAAVRPAWILALSLTGCLLLPGALSAASIRGAVLNSGPAPDRKQMPVGEIVLKGFAKPVSVFNVLGLRDG